ncbi:hypothetical protein [uncultured Flavobacterium sp.]|uniref:hypothetical protein n=1 Tax=uncultured Flavobacterium sp. TaxID=165435 RepID=UPI0030EBCA8B|tara:strand:+ start:665 stop:874 length:210 start_codon:yes stop_codon:yes gene_type:complete
MKKVVLSLALVAMMFVSCKETEANVEEATTEATEAVEAATETAVETVDSTATVAVEAVEAAATTEEVAK